MGVAITFVAVYVPESPRFLLEKGQYEELKRSLETIAKFNKVLDFEFKVSQIVLRLKEN